MKVLRILSTLLLPILMGACTYSGRLERGIYQAPALTPQIEGRVLVVTDHIAQERFVFKDYHEKSSVHSYKIDLADGSLVAATDALGTLFTIAEADTSAHIPSYDYYAQLDYQVSNPRTDSTESIQWLGYSQIPQIQTRVTLTLYKASGEVIFTGYAQRNNRIEMSDASAVTQRLETSGTTALLPITSPLYTQNMGDSLRYTLSRDLKECLQEIITDLQSRWDNL